MKNPSSRRTFAVAAVASLAGAAVVRAPARAARFAWKFAFPLAADHPVCVRAVEAFASIRQETNGDLDIKAYPNSQLGSPPDTITQLRVGALETVVASGGLFDSLVPVASIESLAYAFRNKKGAFAAQDGDLGKLIRAEFPSRGFVAMERIFDNGVRHFTTNSKPIRNVDDLQGLKIRVSPGKLFFDTFRSLGVAITAVSANEIYTALQTHLVDGQETPLAFIEAQRFYEVQKYCSLSHHMWAGLWFLVNREKWESLPRNFQETLRKHINAAALKDRRDSEILDTTLRDKLQRQGLTFNEVDVASLKNKLTTSGYYSRWRSEFGPAAWSVFEKYADSPGS